MYILRTEHIIHAPIEKVWAFFSSPENLNRLTPPEMRFTIESDLPSAMYTGQIIQYKIRIAPLFWRRWVTEIKHVDFQRYFVDEQRFGPYRFWYHEHRFTGENGHVRMTDIVHYIVGFGVIGKMLHRLWIRKQLEKVFEYRRSAIDRMFNQNGLST
jgi:ligand-binding SRPBCC domain-containing protein